MTIQPEPDPSQGGPILSGGEGVIDIWDAIRARRQFLASMGYELRTHVNTITGYTDLLLELEDKSGTAELDRICRLGRQLEQLVSELVDSWAIAISLPDGQLPVETFRRHLRRELYAPASEIINGCQALLAQTGPDGAESSASDLHNICTASRQILSLMTSEVMQNAECPPLSLPLPDEEIERAKRLYGDFETINDRLYRTPSDRMHLRLREDSTEWYLYHTLLAGFRQGYVEIPYQRLAGILGKRPDWVVGDFGCGEARLAASVPNRVYSFDHVAVSPAIAACDMAHVPLADHALDAVVFCLSLMGPNYPDYLAEADRTLKPGGILMIAAPQDRWSTRRADLRQRVDAAGFLSVGEEEERAPFFYLTAIKRLA